MSQRAEAGHIPNIYSGILSDTYSDTEILSGIYSAILCDIYSGILAHISSGTYSNVLYIWHILRYSLSFCWPSILPLRPGFAWRCQLRSGAGKEEEEEEKQLLIKSNNPHLAGGDLKTPNRQLFYFV